MRKVEDFIGEDREGKLPSWAIQRLGVLRDAVRRQEGQIEDLNGTPGLSKTTFLSTVGIGGSPIRTPLRSDQIVFRSPLRFSGRPTETLTEIRAHVQHDGHGVELYCTDGGLVYAPRSQNAGLLIPVDRWELFS